MQTTHYTVSSPRISHPITLAVVTDLHNSPYEEALPALRGCQAILIVGDLVDRYHNRYDRALAFLADAPRIAPTFYVSGNHERRLADIEIYWKRVRASQATLLENTFVSFEGLALGGYSDIQRGPEQAAFLSALARRPEFRLLLSHHPELYASRIRPYGLDLTLSGHAHGGQIQLLGQGIYAPGQGLFPRLTSGFYEDGKLLVSRGLGDATRVPRFNNPRELILLHLQPQKE